MRLAVVVAGLVMLAGCGGSPTDRAGACGDRPIAASVAPDVDSFRLVENALQEPEGCGADFKRHLVYESSASDTDPLGTFEKMITDDGWASTPCVSSSERCFKRGDWFLATTVPGSERLDGYPQPVGTGPQVLAVLERQ